MSIPHDSFPAHVLSLIKQRIPMAVLTGCPISDLYVQDGQLREIRRTIYSGAYQQFGMIPLRADLGKGFRLIPLDGNREEQEKSRRELLASGILEGDQPAEAGYEPEIARVRNAVDALDRSVQMGVHLPPLLIVVPHAHDKVGHPDNLNGSSDTNVALIHCLLDLRDNYAMRGYRIFVILEGDLEKIDSRLAEALPIARCAFPVYEEKLQFLRCLRSTKTHREAVLADGVSIEDVARRTANTPNRSIEEQFFASAQTKTPIDVAQLIDRKKEDIRRQSEGIFEEEDIRGVENVKLEGLSAQVLYSSIRVFVRGVEKGSPWSFQVVVIMGGPGTSKTVGVQLAARNLTLLKWNSPKHHLVGRSEARAQMASRLIREWPGNVYFCDEIDSRFFGLDRRQLDHAGDSGSSGAEISEFLKLSADDALAGKALIVGTTNRPWVFAGAFQSRFERIPVLRPVRGDYPAILESVCNRLAGEEAVSRDDPAIAEAANVFYEKQLFAREIIRAIKRTIQLEGAEKLYPEFVLGAAVEAAEPSLGQVKSFEYSELMSLRLSSSQRYFPWHGRESTFEYPAYLVPLVDGEGQIKIEEADQYLKDIEPFANV